MTATTTRSPSELLAELVAEAIRPHVGSVGVIVRDVLSPDAAGLLGQLKQLDEDEGLPSLCVAYLHDGGPAAAKKARFDEGSFTTEIEQAERWRNDPDLAALIVVVARGDEAKLSSLEDFATVTSSDLKRVLVERALGGTAGENEVQGNWWGMLGEDETVGLGQLVDYYLALEGKDGEAFKKASSRELQRLGLLPDPTFFDSAKPAALRKRLEANRDLVGRLQTLTPKDRRTIKGVVEGEKKAAEKAKLQRALDQLHRTRWEGEGMGAIDFEHAERLIKARTKKPGKKDGATRPTSEQAVNVAAEALMSNSRKADVTEVLETLQASLKDANDSSARTDRVRTALSSSGTEAFTTARLDVINFVAKLLDDGIYGGLVEVDVEDIDDALRRFNFEEHVLGRWERDRIDQVLGHLSEATSVGGDLAKQFAAYDKARTATLPYLRVLAAEPLVATADTKARKVFLTAVEAYEGLTRAVRDSYDDIFEAVGSDVDELVGLILLLDIIVVKAGERVYGVLSPLHPLYMWHYAKFAEIVKDQRKELDERDQELVSDAARRLPNFLTSLYVPAAATGQGETLEYAGRLGPVPYYSEEVESSSSDDAVDTVRDLIGAYVSLEPHARLGFRLALVDPPDAGVYLRALMELHEANALDGAHLIVYRHQKGRLAIELRLDENDEDRVAQLFRALNVNRRFTFEVRDLPDGELGPPDDEPFHLTVVFDLSGGKPTRARPAMQPIQPLAMPRRIHYSTVHETVELEPAPGGLFEAYYKVVGRIAEGAGQASYLAVHQEKGLRGDLGKLAERAAWTAVADRQVDRDLAVGALRVFTGRDGERDVAAFARSAFAFRRALREVARHYNTFITDGELDDLLEQLSDLLDSGLLSLRPDHSGRTNHGRIKGLLGTLIAARWYRNEGSTGDRLLVSLDSKDARRWLHLSDDPQRADLVGFEWTNDHCTVSVIEVKAVDVSSREYTVDDGVVSGPAVDQTLATRRLLAAVLSEDREGELITTPARREVLREHLYRELTKGTYSPDERKLWADRVQRLLDGKVKADVRCHLIDVRLGVDASTLDDRNVVAEDGEDSIPARVTELNEELIDALNQPEVPDDVEPDGGATEADDAGRAAERSAQPPVDDAAAAAVSPEEESAAEDTPPAEEPPSPAPASDREPQPAASAQGRGSSPVDSGDEDAESRLRAFLGTAPGTYGKPRDIWFDPNLPSQKLPNPHISITGETGSGKTQATKAIIADLGREQVPSLILDFKDDYSDPVYVESEGMQLYDANYGSLPFNPLTPAIDRRESLVNPQNHIHQLSSILKRVYKLGDQQAYRFREAVKAAYEAAGVSMRPAPLDTEQPFPPFETVREQLADDKANEALLGRLSPIFDLGLFASTEGQANFEEFLGSSAVVRLGQLPSEEVKNSVAEFFLMAFYNYLIRQSQTHTLGRLLVLDEAWRLVESPFLTPLMREGRAFGLGVVIASQFPRDLPDAVRGSTATRLFFSQSQVEQVREIQRTIVGKSSGAEADHVASVVRGLSPLTALLHSTQHTPFARVSIKPYYERRAEIEASAPSDDE